jgi:hypothetical protein
VAYVRCFTLACQDNAEAEPPTLARAHPLARAMFHIRLLCERRPRADPTRTRSNHRNLLRSADCDHVSGGFRAFQHGSSLNASMASSRFLGGSPGALRIRSRACPIISSAKARTTFKERSSW